VKSTTKNGRTCSSGWISQSTLTCPSTSPSRGLVVRDDSRSLEETKVRDLIDRKERSRGGGVSANHVLGVTTRVLKTAFVTSVVLHTFFGVSVLSGPAAPFLIAGGALFFLAYGIFEKKLQESYKKQLESLTAAADSLLRAFGDNRGGMLFVLKQLVDASEGYGVMHDMKIRMQRQLQRTEDAEKALEARVHDSELSQNLHAMDEGLHSLEGTLRKMSAEIERQHDHIEQLKVKVLEGLRGLGALLRRVKCEAEHVARQIFGKSFKKVMGVWDKVLAGASVAVAGYDLSQITTTLDGLAEGGMETGRALAELLGTGIHAQEIREFFEREENEKAVEGIRKALTDTVHDSSVGRRRIDRLSRHSSFSMIAASRSSSRSSVDSASGRESLFSTVDDTCPTRVDDELPFDSEDSSLATSPRVSEDVSSSRNRDVVEFQRGRHIPLERGERIEVLHSNGEKSILRRRKPGPR